MTFTFLYALVSILFLAAIFGLVLWLRGFKAALAAAFLGGLLVVGGFFVLVTLVTSSM